MPGKTDIESKSDFRCKVCLAYIFRANGIWVHINAQGKEQPESFQVRMHYATPA